ncbi:MAG TPA: hypothetical protein VGN15_03895 [Ktedonobacteraceae bacterium]|nr:hypothetical protein [Ktedonobacteraceae bacterium]
MTKNTVQYNGTSTQDIKGKARDTAQAAASAVQDNVQTGLAKTQDLLAVGLDLAQDLLNRNAKQSSKNVKKAQKSAGRVQDSIQGNVRSGLSKTQATL